MVVVGGEESLDCDHPVPAGLVLDHHRLLQRAGSRSDSKPAPVSTRAPGPSGTINRPPLPPLLCVRLGRRHRPFNRPTAAPKRSTALYVCKTISVCLDIKSSFL
jgi:hypothetical protein